MGDRVAIAKPVFDMAATPVTQSMQSAGPWLPMRASKPSPAQLILPKVRKQSLMQAQPTKSQDNLHHSKNPVTQVSELSPALEKRLEKKINRDIAPAMAAAITALGHGNPAHAQSEVPFITSVAGTMFGLVFFGLAIGFILLRADDILGGNP